MHEKLATMSLHKLLEGVAVTGARSLEGGLFHPAPSFLPVSPFSK